MNWCIMPAKKKRKRDIAFFVKNYGKWKFDSSYNANTRTGRKYAAIRRKTLLGLKDLYPNTVQAIRMKKI